MISGASFHVISVKIPSSPVTSWLWEDLFRSLVGVATGLKRTSHDSRILHHTGDMWRDPGSLGPCSFTGSFRRNRSLFHTAARFRAAFGRVTEATRLQSQRPAIKARQQPVRYMRPSLKPPEQTWASRRVLPGMKWTDQSAARRRRGGEGVLDWNQIGDQSFNRKQRRCRFVYFV